MSDKPLLWMPLYIGDYMGDTMELNYEGHGVYFLLIIHYWQHGPIKNDPKNLRLIARIGSSRVGTRILPQVCSFFELKNGYLYHKRIDEEKRKAMERKDFYISRAKTAAAARWKKLDA